MTRRLMFLTLMFLAFLSANCGSSTPTGPQVVTQCEAPISVSCAPSPGPTATATSNGAPATAGTTP